MSDAEIIRRIADRQAITDLIYRYCRSMDRMDAELGYSIWHDDATVDFEGFYKGSGHGYIDAACKMHERFLAHSHQVTNIIIELDGDRAASESYVTANLRFMQRDRVRQLTVWGRYIDTWSRRGARWGIDTRYQINDLNELRDAIPASAQERTARDRSDFSYSALTGNHSVP